MYPSHIRRKQMIRTSIRLVCHLFITLYIAVLLWIFWRAWNVECIRNLNIWLYGYGIIETLYSIFTVVIIIIWNKANDPASQETRLNVYVLYWLHLINIGWVIYGSTFIYNEESSQCDEETEITFRGQSTSVKALHISTIVLMVLGYFVLLYLVLSCVFACCLYKMYVKWNKMDRETKTRYETNSSDIKNKSLTDRQD